MDGGVASIGSVEADEERTGRFLVLAGPSADGGKEGFGWATPLMSSGDGTMNGQKWSTDLRLLTAEPAAARSSEKVSG